MILIFACKVLFKNKTNLKEKKETRLAQ